MFYKCCIYPTRQQGRVIYWWKMMVLFPPVYTGVKPVPLQIFGLRKNYNGTFYLMEVTIMLFRQNTTKSRLIHRKFWTVQSVGLSKNIKRVSYKKYVFGSLSARSLSDGRNVLISSDVKMHRVTSVLMAHRLEIIAQLSRYLSSEVVFTFTSEHIGSQYSISRCTSVIHLQSWDYQIMFRPTMSESEVLWSTSDRINLNHFRDIEDFQN